ncbi:Cytochrome P450 86B1 [Acorus gramineus]|uniref:Cytochrome P450 86B1 n=1 Tax=Acorus gramineus TaxID=55184 RepID=A0AAV9AK11_ACOGR|nr:Cytochrome P450 86B1 [Acorus gramineus]
MLGLLKSYPEILLALSCFLLLRRCLNTPRGSPINWPLLGMLPGLVGNFHRLLDWTVDLRLQGLTFFFKGPILSKHDFIVTCDPANANHILKSAFANYQKGPDFPKIFDPRKAAHGLFAEAKFRGFVAETSKGNAERALVPMLTRAAELGEVVDLEDVLLRFTFNASCKIVTGVDPNCLSEQEVPFARVFDEAEEVLALRRVTPMWCWKLMSLRGLVYLHAALCETLRLYPPVPFNHKWAAKADVLPSGVSVEAGTRILISMYAMGRMERVWGKDCEEFRPERWITERGRIKYEPSHKFLAFNAGPRTCLGKDMAFTQMKIVAAAMIYNFEVEAVEGHVVEPKLSIILHMKNGFLAKVRKRRGY